MNRKIYKSFIFVIGIVLMGCPNPVIESFKSINANLLALTVSDGFLFPAFSSEITAYTVAVSNCVSSITVTGIKADANASVSYNPLQPAILIIG